MDKMREEFEKWAREQKTRIRGCWDLETLLANGNYKHSPTFYAFKGYQAGYQAATAEAEKYREVLEIFTRAAYPVLKEINARGYNWSEAYLDEALIIAKQALQK